MSSSNTPLVALVGRTNVGKSSLFNRLTETQDALVSSTPGTTRDRKDGIIHWRGQVFNVIDTGGLDIDNSDAIEQNIAKQAEVAMGIADVVLFVVDIRTGLLPQDLELAKYLQKSTVPVIVVANKAEKAADRVLLNDPSWRPLSLSVPLAVSAKQGTGTGDLLDAIFEVFEKQGKAPADHKKQESLRLAFIGRPNVGKSSLTNALLGEERVIVSPVAHTTREPNAINFERNDQHYTLVDTAGMRKKGKVKKTGGLEEEGVERTRSVLLKTDVAFFVLDATEKIGNQEKVLAGLLMNSKAGIVIVVNKWDIAPEKDTRATLEYTTYLHNSIPFLRWAPIVFVSAKTGQRIANLLTTAHKVEENRHREFPYKEINYFFRGAIMKHLPSRHKGPSHPKVVDMKQVSTTPPTFQLTLRAKRIDVLHPSYLRFLENRLRENFPLEGTPVRLRVRGIGDL